MTRRVFYIALGATAGVLLVRRLDASVQRWTAGLQPDHVVRRVVASVDGFVTDVCAGMAEREHELREALGLDAPPDGQPAGGLDGIDPLATHVQAACG